MREVWHHGRRDARQIERTFSKRDGPRLGDPGPDALSTANLLLERIEEKTGLIRVAYKANAFGVYELNAELKPLLDDWVQSDRP